MQAMTLPTINAQIRESTYELAKLERIVEERRRKLTEAMNDQWKLREHLHCLHAQRELQVHKELETSINA